MKGKLFSALAAVVLCVSAAHAQNVAISQDGRPERMANIRLVKGLNARDMKALQEMYFGNAFEIKAAEIAMRRARGAWAKQYAKEMHREHTMAQNNLKLLAQDKGIDLKDNLPREVLTMLRKLENVSAGQFDETYRQMMLKSHAKASTVLQQCIKHGHDEDVRGWATIHLPPVKDHYSLAQTRQTMMGATKTRTGV